MRVMRLLRWHPAALARAALRGMVGLPRALWARRFKLGVALLFAALLWKMLAPAPAATYTSPPQLVFDQLQISAPDEVQAGEPFEIEVEGMTPNVPVELVVDGGYHGRLFTETSSETSVIFAIPPALSPESGTIQLTAIQGQRVATGSFTMLPGEAVDPLNVYLGPRTVVADTEHFTMVVTIPRDVWGNPVLDGTEVNYTVNRPNGVVDTAIVETDGLLAWLNIFSRTKVGRTRVGIEVGTAGGVEETFLEVADIPEPYSLVAVGAIPLADGAALITVRTSELVDQFDNPLPDGTTVFLDMEGVSGTRHLWGETIKSVAEFTFEAPEETGAVWLTATASGVASEPLRLLFAPAVSSFPFSTTATEDGLRVDVGQVRSQRQSYVPDGTTAWVTALGETYPVLLNEGLGSITIPDAEPDDISVVVLGTQGTLES